MQVAGDLLMAIEAQLRLAIAVGAVVAQREQPFVTLETGYPPRRGQPPVDVTAGREPEALVLERDHRGSAGAGVQRVADIAVQLPARLERYECDHGRFGESKE